MKDRHARAGIVVRSSNYLLYGDMSARVMSVLSRFTPDLEIYSIDEAFLGLAGFEQRLEDHARELRATVLLWTGISVGIAPTKTLAKVANKLAKKEPSSGGVRILLTEEAQRDALGHIDLTDLWGVAERMALRLMRIGINTPLALRGSDPRRVRQEGGVVMERTVHELRGTPCIRLEEVAAKRKSLIASRSFGRPVTERHELEQSVSVFTARAAEKMRRQGLASANLTVMAETNQHKPQEPQYRAQRSIELPVATADTGRLLQAAQVALGRIWRPGFRYKKAGVMLLDLVDKDSVAGGLFDEPDDERSRCRMAAIDLLNRRFGRGTVGFGSAGEKQRWTLRRDFVSRRYTTSFDELLCV